MFSRRLPQARENRLSLAMRAHAERPVLDWTAVNPTQLGFAYPKDLLAPLGDAASLTYVPSAQGDRSAREAIARRYIGVNPDQIWLTSSTSEAYAHLFRLLCDPGDSILVPRPSYPLFEHLAALESVEVAHYPLRYHSGWFVESEELAALITERTRAIVVVHPNNPTGSFLKPDEAEKLEALAAQRDLAIISDEVFSPYAYDSPLLPSLAGRTTALTFALGGLSKLGLPQMKLGWIIASGPASKVALAADGLEHLCDTFLSVSQPIALAAPRWLDALLPLVQAINNRVRENRQMLVDGLRGSSISVLAGEGGWSAVLAVPHTRSDEAWALALIDRDVFVHPGYFYDFEESARLVVSLLVEKTTTQRAIEQLLEVARIS